MCSWSYFPAILIQQFLLDLSEFNILIPIEYNNSSDPIGPIVITNDIGHEIEKKKITTTNEGPMVYDVVFNPWSTKFNKGHNMKTVKTDLT